MIGSMLATLDTFQNSFQNLFSSTKSFGDRSLDTETILSSRLSSNASIFLPGSSEFSDATLRWQEWESPNITIVVEVATEDDVQETVSCLKIGSQDKAEDL
jgi:hypothetical protein